MSDLVEIIITAKDLSKGAFASTEGSARSLGSTMSKVGLGMGAALVGIGIEAVKMASNYQSAVTRLQTSAGESAANLKMVGNGMLTMAGQVGMSATELAKGMYTVESAGYHGADGLTVLKAAAQGAKDENADLGTVANAVTDVLTDYHMKAADAANVTSQLVEGVSFGKTTFEQFSKAMSNILPIAGSVHLSLADVSGVLAEMTAHGMTAQRASMNEAQAIRSLIAPSGTMVAEFKLLGITSAEVTDNLGTVGLAGTMQWLSTVAKDGAGKIGQNYTEALRKLMGTAPGLAVALMTTGENANATEAAIAGISKSSADAKGNVQGFAEIQATLKQQLSQVNAEFDSMMIRLGTALIPKVTTFLELLQSKGGPVLSGLGKILSQVASGFDGVGKSVAKITTPVANIMKAFTAPSAISLGGTERALGVAQPTVAQLPGGERPILPAAAAAISKSVAEMAPPPDMTAWQKVGKTLGQIAGDVKTAVLDVARSGKNLVTALAPAAAFLAGAALGAIKGVAVVLADYLGPALVAVTGFLAQNKGVVSTLVEAFVAWKVATEANAAAQLALNLVLDANPFSLIVLAIAAVVGGLVMLWQHCETAREIMATVFAAIATVILTEVQVVLLVVKALADGVLDAAYMVVKALSYIPGPTQSAMKAASKGIEGFRNDSDRFFNGAIKDVSNWRNAALNMPKEIKLEGDISSMTKQLATAKAQLKTVPSSQRVALLAKIDQLTAGIASAKADVASLQGKTVDVKVHYSATGSTAIPGGPARGGFAHGGVVSTAATGGIRGLTWVGEQGPELVRLPQGSMVYPSGQSRHMAGQGGAQEVRVVLEFASGGTSAAEALLHVLRKEIRIRGGNVQIALGQSR